MKKDNLIDLLDRYKGLNIKVGFIKGSGFIFCDKCTDKTLDILIEIEKDEKEKGLIELEKATNNYSNLNNQGFESFKAVEIMRITNFNKQIEIENANEGNRIKRKPLEYPEDKDLLRVYNNRLNYYQKEIESLTDFKKIENPVIGAEVVDVYPSFTEEKTMIIILDGFIKGNYWDVEEYQENYKEDESEESVTVC